MSERFPDDDDDGVVATVVKERGGNINIFDRRFRPSCFVFFTQYTIASIRVMLWAYSDGIDWLESSYGLFRQIYVSTSIPSWRGNSTYPNLFQFLPRTTLLDGGKG